MAIDPTRVQEVAPQFTDAARIAAFLARAERAHTKSAWGAVYEDAMAFYAAHLLTRFPAAAEAAAAAADTLGGVNARGAGDLSESYADAFAGIPSNEADADLRTSTYGRAYLRLRATRTAAAPTTIRVYNP